MLLVALNRFSHITSCHRLKKPCWGWEPYCPWTFSSGKSWTACRRWCRTQWVLEPGINSLEITAYSFLIWNLIQVSVSFYCIWYFIHIITLKIFEYRINLEKQLNRLLVQVLKVVRKTLQDLLLAIEGTIIMSTSLKDMLDAMYDARVPERWRKVCMSRVVSWLVFIVLVC